MLPVIISASLGILPASGIIVLCIADSAEGVIGFVMEMTAGKEG